MPPHTTPLGQYQLIEKISQGGMAEIFRGKAVDSQGLEKPVVIKRILPHIAANPEFVNMLIDEAKIAVMLSHGNIAQVYDLGKIADDYFIVMEYVAGKTLSQIMKRLLARGDKMPVPEALYICTEIANGLSYMHGKTDDQGQPMNIVHRDISPQNIIVSHAGTIKIIDFGIAKAKIKMTTTDSGVVKGKFAYMSPEHADGQKLDARTDIFSLGVILFELLTGQRLFKGKNNRETLRNVRKAPVPRPSELRPQVVDALDRVVVKALERDLERRYDSAHSFHDDLRRLLFQYDPNFASRRLITLLKNLFPEEEISERVDTKMGLGQTIELEETLLASKKQMKAAQETLDPYQGPDQPEASAKSSQETPEGANSKTTTRGSPPGVPRLRPLFRRRMVVGLVALGLLLAGVWVWQELKPRTGSDLKSNPPTQLGFKVPPPTTRPVEQGPLAGPPTSPEILQGTLVIQTQPPGAHVFINEREQKGLTPLSIPNLPLKTPFRVGLHAAGHVFWEDKITLEETKERQLTVTLSPNYGELAVISLPAGAELYLNGRYAGVTPYHQTEIPPDSTYEILLKLSGYQDWKSGAKVFGGKKEVVSARLQPLKKQP